MSMPRPKRKIQPYVDAKLAYRLESYCATQGHKIGGVVESALIQYLERETDADLIYKRLDRHGRSITRVQRDLDALMESFSVFVQMWFAVTPETPADQRASAHQKAAKRYKDYVTYVSKKLSSGELLIDDIAKNVADDHILSEALRDEEYYDQQNSQRVDADVEQTYE